MRSWTWFGLAVLLAPSAAAARDRDPSLGARVTVVDSDLFARVSDHGDLHRLGNGDVLREGEELVTPRDAFAEIELEGGTYLRLGENSEVWLDRLGSPSEVTIAKGSVYVSRPDDGPAIRVYTGKLAVSALADSVIRVEAAAPRPCVHVGVARGRAELSDGRDRWIDAESETLGCGRCAPSFAFDTFDAWSNDREQSLASCCMPPVNRAVIRGYIQIPDPIAIATSFLNEILDGPARVDSTPCAPEARCGESAPPSREDEDAYTPPPFPAQTPEAVEPDPQGPPEDESVRDGGAVPQETPAPVPSAPAAAPTPALTPTPAPAAPGSSGSSTPTIIINNYGGCGSCSTSSPGNPGPAGSAPKTQSGVQQPDPGREGYHPGGGIGDGTRPDGTGVHPGTGGGIGSGGGPQDNGGGDHGGGNGGGGRGGNGDHGNGGGGDGHHGGDGGDHDGDHGGGRDDGGDDDRGGTHEGDDDHGHDSDDGDDHGGHGGGHGGHHGDDGDGLGHGHHGDDGNGNGNGNGNGGDDGNDGHGHGDDNGLGHDHGHGVSGDHDGDRTHGDDDRDDRGRDDSREREHEDDRNSRPQPHRISYPSTQT